MYFKQLIVWQKAMAAREIYQLVPLLPREETYGMRSQLTRAVVSIPANIAEGWARESDKEKAHFLAIAQGSLAEADTLLTLCEELGWFPGNKAAIIHGLFDEVGRMLTAMRRHQRLREEPEPYVLDTEPSADFLDQEAQPDQDSPG